MILFSSYHSRFRIYRNYFTLPDITYIPIKGGFVYLCAIIDWHSKTILSWKISTTMDTSLVTDVLKEAIEKYDIPVIFNSDQGSQYTSHEHTELLKKHNIQISMNGKGRSIDNIAIERFFRTLKYDEIYINEPSFRTPFPHFIPNPIISPISCPKQVKNKVITL